MESRPNNAPLEELLALLELMRPVNPPKKPTKSLLGAVFDDDPGLVKIFLAAGANPNQSGRYASPLGRAVCRGKLEVLDLLIAAGAKDVGSCIAAAAERGDMAIINRIFEAGVDLEKHGAAALGAAAYHNQVAVVELLLKKGVPVSADNYLAVSQAARHASIEVLRVLFASGVKPEHAGRALRMAAGSPLAFAGVKFLVDAGVDPLNHPDYAFNDRGEPVDPPVRPADVAAENNQPEVADYLRGKPIDVDGLLAREEARRREWDTTDLEEVLLQEKAERTAHLLRGAARVEAVQRAVKLINSAAFKSSVNEAGKSGQTALALAAKNGDLEIVSALLEAGADANQVDKRKNPPLLLAAEAGHTLIVERLLKGAVDVNTADDRGNTALIEAADWDDPVMVKLLLDAGADPKAEDQGGRTPMNVEHGLRGAEVKALLREAVKRRAGDKPEKGQGLSFVKGKSKGAPGPGVEAFRKFYNGQPDWAVVFVRAAIEDVARAYAEAAKPVRWEQDVAKKKVSSAARYTYLLQLKDNPWTSILLSLGSLSEAQLQEAERVARRLSKKLATRACTYLGADVSAAEAYELFEDGESLEKATECETIEFESKQRPRPKFEAGNFPEPVFANEGISLPACYPKDDGYDAKLVLEGVQKGEARADLMVWEE